MDFEWMDKNDFTDVCPNCALQCDAGFFRTVGFRTCCRQRAPWFSFPPEKPGAAQEPPGDCWEPAGERDCSRSQ